MVSTEWHNLSIEQVFESLKTSSHGLSDDEAAARLKKYGQNILPEEKKFSGIKIFFDQFHNALIYVLMAAAIVSFVIGHASDSYIIVAAIFINVIVGFFQEYRANDTLEKLRQIMKFSSHVVRDGRDITVDASLIVPGDIIILKAGNRVPADARLISEEELEINEAALTGESYPVKKVIGVKDAGVILAERVNMAFAGTTVALGRGRAIVVATGIDSEFGKIAKLTAGVKEKKTPLQEKIVNFSKQITIIICIVTFLIFVTGIILGQSVQEMFMIAVALAVAAVPEGLVISVTAILAIGMRRILADKGLARQLAAAETLGSVTYICTDKTGTLTEGNMRVSEMAVPCDKCNFDFDITGSEHKALSFIRLLEIAVLASEATVENPHEELKHWRVAGSSTEAALLKAAATIGIDFENLRSKFPGLDLLPFSSLKKFMIVLHKGTFSTKPKTENKNLLLMKGAPEVVFAAASYLEDGGHMRQMTEHEKLDIQARFESMSSRGLRVLAFAYKEIDKSEGESIKDICNPCQRMVFAGFVGLKDPLRADVRESLQITNRAGIKVAMITGDHKLTAAAIATELGIPAKENNIITGEELKKLSDNEFLKRVKNITVYARTTPEDKLRIVNTLREAGESVAMTGDGVNDAPALKSADIGVALGSGTDAAKSAANLVLLDDSFSTLVKSVREGRIIYDNIRKVLLYLISNSFAEVIVVASSVILRLPFPVLAGQLLWINLMEHSLPGMAFAFEPEAADVMIRRPRDRFSQLLDSKRKALAIIISIACGIGGIFLFFLTLKGGDLANARTVTFMFLSLTTLLSTFSIRSTSRYLWQSNPFSNLYLTGAVALSICGQLAAVYFAPLQKLLSTVPLHRAEWITIGLSLLALIVIIEVTKGWFINKEMKK